MGYIYCNLCGIFLNIMGFTQSQAQKVHGPYLYRCDFEPKRKCLKHPDYQKLDWTPKIWKDGNILDAVKGADFQLVYKWVENQFLTFSLLQYFFFRNSLETGKDRFFPCPKHEQGRWKMISVDRFFPSPETRIQEDGTLQVEMLQTIFMKISWVCRPKAM